MDHRTTTRFLATGRIAVGTSLVAAPGRAGSGWIGDDAGTGGVPVLTRALGIRDLALGVGTRQALRSGAPVRPWVLLSAVCDAVDAAATLLAIRRIGVRRALPVLVVAGGAAALGIAALDEVDP